jgi:hypothetical protein
MLLDADTDASRALARQLMQEPEQVGRPHLLGSIIDRIKNIPEESRLTALDAFNQVADTEASQQESEWLLSFAELVSIQLTGLSNGLTRATRDGLLRLARSESVSLVERVAAAGFVYLRDDGDVKNEAEAILKHLASMGPLPSGQELAQYVRSVLREHNRFAEELASELWGLLELSSVLSDLRVAVCDDDDDVIMYAEGPSSHRDSTLENPRKRKVDCVVNTSDSNKERRVDEGDVCVTGDSHNFLISVQVERFGEYTGTLCAQMGAPMLTDASAKALYMDDNPEATASELEAFLKGHRAGYEKAKGTPEQQAERLGQSVGEQTAKTGALLFSAANLKAWYEEHNPEATKSELEAFLTGHRAGYEKAKGTPEQQAERLGQSVGEQTAKTDAVFFSAAKLKAWYMDDNPEATQSELEAFLKGYRDGYEKAKGTPEQEAGRLGRYKGEQTAKTGALLSSDENLKAWYKKYNPEVTKSELEALLKGYRDGYEKAKGTPEQQAERLGQSAGEQGAKAGALLSSDENLKAWYKKCNPEATASELEAFLKGYRDGYGKAKGTPEQQAERLGQSSGEWTAKTGALLPSDEKLKASYKKRNPVATASELEALLKGYRAGYEKAKGTPEQEAGRLGRYKGEHAAKTGALLPSDENLKASYKKRNPVVTASELEAFLKGYRDGYEKAKGTPPSNR